MDGKAHPRFPRYVFQKTRDINTSVTAEIKSRTQHYHDHPPPWSLRYETLHRGGRIGLRP